MNRGISALSLFLFCCHGAFAATGVPVSIEIGNFSPEYGKEWLQKEIASFEKAHPDIHVEQFSVLDPPRYKNPIEQLPRLAANVVTIDSESAYETEYYVERDMLVPVDAFLPDSEFQFYDFYDSTWDAVRYKDKTWGVPWTYWTVLLVIDEELFNSAGIKSAPRTWDEFLADAQQLTKDTNGDGQIDQWGLRLALQDESIPYAMAAMTLQNGGCLMENGKFNLSNGAFVNAVEFFAKLAKDPTRAQVDGRVMADVARDKTKKYAMHLVPNFNLSQVPRSSGFRVVRLPSNGNDTTVAPCRKYFAVRKSSPEQEKASWKFVKWMTRADVSLPEKWDVFPCRKSILSRADVQNQAMIADGIDVALGANGIAFDLGDRVCGRREALIDLSARLMTLIASGTATKDALPAIEKEANALIHPIEAKKDSLELYR